jgi:hypothetical protein
MTLRYSLAALFTAAFTLLAGPVLARCSQNVGGMPGVQVASLDGLYLANGNSPNRATITFLGHASYQIDTPQGVRAITDYNGVNGFGRKPDIVTMNNAHSRTSPTIPRRASPMRCAAGPASPARPRPSTTSR